MDKNACPPRERWLLDSDPSIRWQVLRDLLDASEEEVQRERAKVAERGWGAQLLGLQQEDGNWGGGPWVYRSWASTLEILALLREFGVDPRDPGVVRATQRVREGSNWGEQHAHAPFFAGESEPCINGRVLACGAYFGHAEDRLVERLLDEQLPCGGWNCDAPLSRSSSFNTTLCVLEGLLEYERSPGARLDVRDARLRGQEYLLCRRLTTRLSTGTVIERDRKGGTDWRRFAFPTYWHYDLLWALDYTRRAGALRDERLSDAIAYVAAKCDDDGRWCLEEEHAGTTPLCMEEGVGMPSRWLTLRALQVLRSSGAMTSTR